MSTAERAARTVEDRVRPGALLRLLLALVVLCALIRPGFILYTEYGDHRFAEQPFGSLLIAGLVAPAVIVPAAAIVMFKLRTWPAIERIALLVLPVGWLLPWFVAPMNFGCSDVGGLAQPCGVTPISAPREAIVLATTACVASVAIWLHRRAVQQIPS